MRKSLRILIIVMVVLVVLLVSAIAIRMYCDLHGHTSPIYTPGRDTLKYWNDGECEIVGRSSRGNVLRFNGEDISPLTSFIKAYRQIDQQLFFIMTEGRIVVDLEAGTYEIYEEGESVDSKYSAAFDDYNAFTWLPADE